MRNLSKLFTSAFVLAGCAACSLCPSKSTQASSPDIGPPLPIWAADTRIPGVERHGEQVKCDDPAFNDFLCAPIDDWEKHYLRTIIGIDPDDETIDRE